MGPRIPTHRTTRTVARPHAEVAQWMARPGAVERLTPPWVPLQVQQGSEDLRAGTARFTLPGGLPVRSRHQPQEFEEGTQFADVVELPVLGRAPWHHLHRYEPAPGGRTRLIDQVTAPVPARGLERAASYRARQVSGDLDVHETMRGLLPDPERPLTIGLTGASGTIGSALAALLTTGGHRVVRLVRGKATGPDERHWDTERPAADLAHGLDALVHLAGAPIAGRFTDKHKAAVRDSRVGPTAALARVAGEVPFISASAIGFYGADRGEEILTEDAAPGEDFLAEVVCGWEADAAQAAGRSVMVRTGIVQSAAGGALSLQLPLYRAGLGGPLDGGRQWQSWIGLDDLLDVYYRAVVDSSLEGPVNAVSPHPVRQKGWAVELGRVLRRPALLPTPAAAPAALLGRDGAELVAMASQRVRPQVLLQAGHTFRYPHLRDALAHELGRSERTEVGARTR